MKLEDITGYRIKKLRKENNYTQKQLADILNVTQTTIYAWETFKQRPSFEHIETLAKLFNIEAEYFYGHDARTSELIQKINNTDFILNSNNYSKEIQEKALENLEKQNRLLLKLKSCKTELPIEDQLSVFIEIDKLNKEYWNLLISQEDLTFIFDQPFVNSIIKVDLTDFPYLKYDIIKNLKYLDQSDCEKVLGYISALKEQKDKF